MESILVDFISASKLFTIYLVIMLMFTSSPQCLRESIHPLSISNAHNVVPIERIHPLILSLHSHTHHSLPHSYLGAIKCLQSTHLHVFGLWERLGYLKKNRGTERACKQATVWKSYVFSLLNRWLCYGHMAHLYQVTILHCNNIRKQMGFCLWLLDFGNLEILYKGFPTLYALTLYTGWT